MKKFVLLTIICILMSCNSDDSAEVFTEAATFLDVSYGSHNLQKMDIYLPGGRSSGKTKILVLIHGGGWAGGDKADYATSINAAREKFPDYALVNMNYRLVGNGTDYMLPAQTDDIHSVLNFLEGESQEYGIKPEFVLTGTSAGGHLSMLYSYKYDVQKSENGGEYCWTDESFRFLLLQLPRIFHTYPIYYESGNFTFRIYSTTICESCNLGYKFFGSHDFFFGDIDELVPPSQKTALDSKLNQFGVPNESYLYNGGHGIGGIYQEDVLTKAKNFVYKYSN
ncbi:hypothetical protein CHRY9390_01050 [Chryseobacterium aquaeductus]|uniref:BD-FAE-like domain-containing protein n=1 Tax=Chryseobacterium aquaeductus TaxID=2675056 RepID=A0A9N8MM40_9FLAO|nr:alpha/beta hydrolase [Chryseobacterium aquaeductus]CAA7330382.1 hypothetical protein CHRY9390_01050 [Chryseobacterium potabilaquae]CAD7803245.1 hypothetical protein CHRY9390_01050 [Chryseobacterium aquaeductus]